ncbi:phytol kinase [Ranunculus cassubicifolius]
MNLNLGATSTISSNFLFFSKRYSQERSNHHQYRFRSRFVIKASLPDLLSCSTISSLKPPLQQFLDFSNSHGGTFLQDAGATALVSVGAYGLVRLFDALTERNFIKQNLSRKVVHILSGLFFMLSWPIFSTSTEARYFAAFVPLLNCARLLIHGLELAPDEGLVKSVTREGNPKELLRGPLYYVLILISSAVLFWRESPIGVIALAMMCGGDGFADIIGRRFGSVKIPYNQQKSLAGSVSMFLFGFLMAILVLYYYSALGFFQLDWSSVAERVALVALVATIVESLSTTEVVDDNISVPLSSMLMAFMFFG